MVLTGPFLIAFLIYMVYRLNRKEQPGSAPKTKTKALLINSRTGSIDPITIPADWNEYAKVIGTDQITIGARGPGYVVFTDAQANRMLNMDLSGGFRILGGRSEDFKGSGLVVPTGAAPQGFQVEIFVLGEEASYIHQVGM